MKCPKCAYLGFESGDRCRNCGYDFSLSVERPEPPELSLRTGNEPHGPLADLKLTDIEMAEPDVRPSIGTLDLDRIIGAPPEPTPDLPLFNGASTAADDRPLVTPSQPRIPLAVRRATPETPRLRTPRPERMEAPTLDLEPPRVTSPMMVAPPRQSTAAVEREPPVLAGPGRRLVAAAIDLLILAAIHSAVLYFTLRLSQWPSDRIRELPWMPLGSFLLLLTSGYLIVFTAVGGQTIGKMAVGLRVASGDGPVDVSHAVIRFLGSALTLLTLGIGYLPALFGESHRALHDRLAGTDVVRQPPQG